MDNLKDKCEIKSYVNKEIIYDKQNFKKSIGIVLKGKAIVIKLIADGRRIILNTKEPSELFGAATLFNENVSFVTEICSKGRCTILFISEETLIELFKLNFSMAQNYICFLSERINFLNRKIDGFTASSAEERLALYLLENASLSDNGYEAIFECSAKDLSETLGIGRASLYRIIDVMTEQGIIQRVDKKINITNIKLLKEIIK